MSYGGFTYILTNSRQTVLYIGVTANLDKRMSEHKERKVPGFTMKYKVDRLVYFESFDRIEEAIAREKYLKGKTRQKKVNLINDLNPTWKDLSLHNNQNLLPF